MRNIHIKVSSFTFIIFIVFAFSSCTNRSKISKSDMLEKAITGVVTIKLDETAIGKSGFGFADTTLTKLSAADIAYADVLKLTNAKSTGSGFVIEMDGKKYVITNVHVIEKAKDLEKNIVAYSYDRKEYLLKLVGADTYYDIAVLAFVNNPDSSISPLNFGEENYRIGQSVFAIGNPLSFFPYTVTEGIISAKNRSGINSKSGYLQSTAMLSPGNSGGPLINDKGELVGVNTLGSPEAQQLNFSLESKILKRIVKDIVQIGRVKRAYFGIEVTQLYQYSLDKNNHLIAEVLNQKPILYNVFPNSPAQNVLTDYRGYSIIKANGKTISSNEDLFEILEALKPNETLKLSLEKDDVVIERELSAEELTDDNLSEIGQFYFKEHYNITLEKNESGVVLNYPEGMQNNSFQVYDKTSEKFSTYIPRGEKAYLVACGNTKGINDVDFWRTNDFKDVGIALRLAAPTGQISYLDYDTKVANIVRVLISDRKDIISKTILY